MAIAPAERSFEQPAHFVLGEIVPIALEVRPESAVRETNCKNGSDDDGDGAADCLDSDCEAQLCLSEGSCRQGACRGTTSEASLCDDGLDNDADGTTDCEDSDCLGALCLAADHCVRGGRCTAAGGCEGGQPMSCQSPPNGSCFNGSGACVDGGCQYTPKTNVPCNDDSVCTVDDRCSDAGVCTGTQLNCGTAPSVCFSSVGGYCDPVAGCRYPVLASHTCDDGQACTTGDVCDADGGCAGAVTSCFPNECQTYANTCLTDGGCDFAIRPLGLGCASDAGVCNGGGGCIPLFPFSPSNFVETQVPTPPTSDVVLDCGEVIIDTGGGGPPTISNWCAGQALPGTATLPQPGGPDAVMLSFTRITIGPAAIIRLRGERPVIIAATQRLSLQGQIDVQSGPYACVGGIGGPGEHKDTNGGGAGGTFGTTGGAGADAPNGLSGSHGAGGTVGTTEGSPALIPLRGGCAGGVGGDNTNRASLGGGALQITAGTELVIGGSIFAAGRGGAAGSPSAFNNSTAGNGAGSGGALLLESSLVTLSTTAVLATNGGGGGQSGGITVGGENGEPGTADGGPASGGNISQIAGKGGRGAAGSVTAGAGGAGLGVVGGGGGGGGLGRIRLNASLACSLSPAALLSPVPSYGNDAGCP